MKKELVKHFSFKDFFWIDDILEEEEDEGEGERIEYTPTEEGRVEDTPFDRVSPINVIDVANIDVKEIRADEPEDPAPLLFFITLMRTFCPYFH